MPLKLGQTIRAFRKRRGLTQEQLALCLSVSCQAVSKWENDQTLPDLALVPALTRALGVTADELFGAQDAEADIDALCGECAPLIETDPEKARRLLAAALEKYPASDRLLHSLLYVTNYTLHPRNTLAIASRLMACARSDSLKYDALRFSAYAYGALGDTAAALDAVNRLPDLTFTRLTELAYALTGPAQLEAANRQLWVSLENLLQMLQKMAENHAARGDREAASRELRRALAFIELMRGDPRWESLSPYRAFFERQLK